MEFASGLLLGLGGYLLIVTVLHFLFPESHLDWSKVNLENIAMPQGFVWGVATASHQIEGDNTTIGRSLNNAKVKNRVASHAITGSYGPKTMNCYQN